ncbi:hypothetical protein O7608_20425 [Solwaraspora sp. WMMA2056]|uniref:hypothetical protein n=1 Tax=Solwaraspora sp. WMMA2056 TaxID=3015161 RepID=UPI00259BC62E|nr:hypothetical protein [Solwaraspora sp. WMMA2056]WJK38856.1 hypothetical protein O7608_20425 [Solwaraspora sp. WMMA2056]
MSSSIASQPAGSQSVSGPGRRPSRRTLWIVVAVVAALLVSATIVAVVVESLGSRTGRDDARVVQVQRGDRDQARLEVLDGATDLRIVADDLGDQLVRAETPADGAVLPQLSEADGAVRIGLVDSGDGGAAVLEIRVHRDVLWSIRIAGGATSQRVDLGAARVSEVDLAGGASTMDLVLPVPDGTVAVRMSGGVSTWRVAVPADVGVRVRLGSGAGGVSLDGARRDGVAGGETLTTTGWEQSTDRYDIDAVAGVAELTVTSGR